jgi:hypothetical protein
MLLSTVFSALLNRRAILVILGARQLLVGKLVEPAGGLNGKVGMPRGSNPGETWACLEESNVILF